MGAPKTIQVTMALQEAVPEHFGDRSGIFPGRMFFLKRTDGKIDPRPYYTGGNITTAELRAWFREKRVLEPVHPERVIINEET